jgi:transcriptional regulator with XRE-family HTH domain
MKYDQTKIGKRILKERRIVGYSNQSSFAVAMGYSEESRQTVANWEKGKTTPCMEDYLRMCELFDCELGYLLCEFDCKTREVTDIQAAIGLTEKAIKAIREITSPDKNENIFIERRRVAFDKFLTADMFPDFFHSICDLYSSFISPQEREFKRVDDAIDYMRELLYRMKVEHYELNESLTRLVDEIFPKPFIADLSNLRIEESFEEYDEREKNRDHYYNELYMMKKAKNESNENTTP